MMNSIYCRQCGQPNPQGSRFCNGCGAPIAMSRGTAPIANAAPAGEHVVFTLRPALIFVITRYVLAGVLTAALLILYPYLNDRLESQIPWWTLLIAAALVFAVPFYHHVLRQREVYTLTTSRIEFTYGILAKIRRNIPLSKVQDVTVTRSALERLVGIGDIVIDSAAESGKIPLRNVRDPEKYADLILRQIQRV